MKTLCIFAATFAAVAASPAIASEVYARFLAVDSSRTALIESTCRDLAAVHQYKFESWSQASDGTVSCRGSRLTGSPR